MTTYKGLLTKLLTNALSLTTFHSLLAGIYLLRVITDYLLQTDA